MGDLLVARLKDHGRPRDCHPGDIIPWVRTDDLAQMTWLAATHPAPGQRFLAVDRNVMLGEYFVPLMAALGQPVTAAPGSRSAAGAASGRSAPSLVPPAPQLRAHPHPVADPRRQQPGTIGRMTNLGGTGELVIQCTTPDSHAMGRTTVALVELSMSPAAGR